MAERTESSNTEKTEKSDIQKTKQNNLGVYLNLKTRLKSTFEIFDYSSKDNKNLNTFIDKRTYICMNENDDNIKTKFINQNEILLLINREGDKYYINNMIYKNYRLNLENLRRIHIYLWYVINSDSNSIINTNEDYYLKEGDIIKIGKVKLFVKKLFIIGKQETEEEKLRKDNFHNNYMIECKDIKKCEFCDEKIFRLCQCNEYQHKICIENWIKQRKFEKENKKKTVHNYYFHIFFCDERIKKDKYCNESFCNGCNCKYCNTLYPLKFKYKEIIDKKEKEEIIDFYPIKEPENSSYIILESLEYKDDYKNSGQYIKSLHVIELNENNEIIIGREQKNDVILNHSSVCKQHAKIKYIGGEVLLKNISLKAGTLVLIQKEKLDLSTKPLFLQVNKTFIETQIMNEQEYLSKKKNNESKYPLSDIDNGQNKGNNKNNNNENNNNENNNSEKKSNIKENSINESNNEVMVANPSYGSKFYDYANIQQQI